MFQFGIGTSMPSCNRWLFPAAANILLAFIPPLKSVGFPTRQVINLRKMYTSTTLNRTFISERCNVVILLESDRNEHERITGHSRFTIHDLAIGREELECGENS